MDNASFHPTLKIEQMCAESGVKIIYLHPYSPDLNPIEEFFSELKQFIKRKWNEYEVNPNRGMRRNNVFHYRAGHTTELDTPKRIVNQHLYLNNHIFILSPSLSIVINKTY
jgi:transposase